MPRIEFGFILPGEIRHGEHRPALVERMNQALKLAAGHFDSFWMIDHLQSGDAWVLEGLTTLAYFSALHPQLDFGTFVTCQSFRNPALLAKMAATLQLLSGGRFLLGLGAGWNEAEYEAYGYEFPPASVRVEQLDETLRIVRQMWLHEKATFEGRHYRVAGARCEPRPEPAPPIMVGASGSKMLRLAAKYADWWNVSSTGLAAYRSLSNELDQACLEIGRNPVTLRKTWGGGCACAPTYEAAVELTGDWMESDEEEDDFDFVGTPEDLIEQMLAFVDLGVDYFMLDCGGFPNLMTLELLVSEVIPAVRDYGAGFET